MNSSSEFRIMVKNFNKLTSIDTMEGDQELHFITKTVNDSHTLFLFLYFFPLSIKMHTI